MGLEKISVARRIPDVAIVVFGMDRAKKMHASRFGSAAAKSAQAAAREMGLRSVRVVTPEQRAIADRLPKGRLSASGKAVVPFVKPALYRKLLAVAGSDAPPSSPQPASSPKPPMPPADGAKKPAASGDSKPDSTGGSTGIAKGAVVLATDDPTGAMWWPATVQFIDGELLTLRWQSNEWRDVPAFFRRQSQVSVMPRGKPC